MNRNQGVALQNDATITRYNDTLTANYVLSDATGKEITHGTQSSLSSYNVANAPYSTLSAQQDADKRAVQDIADRIRIDLGVFLRRSGRANDRRGRAMPTVSPPLRPRRCAPCWCSALMPGWCRNAPKN